MVVAVGEWEVTVYLASGSVLSYWKMPKLFPSTDASPQPWKGSW